MSDQRVSRVLVADHELPEQFHTGHVEVRHITMGSGVPAGPHEHNGPVFGVILAGAVHFQVADQPTHTLRAGDIFYEPGEERIARFDAQDDGVEFLAWFLLPAGQTGTMTPLA